MAQPTSPSMTSDQHARLAEVVRQRSGCRLAGDRESAERALNPRLQQLGLEDYAQYLQFLTTGPCAQEEFQELFSRVRTPSAPFFHNAAQLSVFEKSVLPAMIKARGDVKRLRIWVPGCGTGEDAYTIAMIIHRALDGIAPEWRIQVLGTDFCQKSVEHAENAVFNAASLRKTDPRAKQYLKLTSVGWTVEPAIRAMVNFEMHNPTDRLAAKRYGVWDAIVCRGLLDTMEAAARQRALHMFADQLSPEGWLMVGANTPLNDADNCFGAADCGNGCYRPQAPVHASASVRRIGPDEQPRLRIA